MKRTPRLFVFLSLFLAISMLLPNLVLAFGPAERAVSRPSAVVDPATAGLTSAGPVTASGDGAVGGATPFAGDPATGVVSAAGPFAQPATPAELRGRLFFAPAIDLDGNPASNPIGAEAVPVMNLMGYVGGMVMLAAQLEADDPRQVPIGVPVTFRLWQEGGRLYEQTILSDAWGAASLEIPVADISGDYAYQASAPGFGTTEVRYFYFDAGRVSHVLHPDGGRLEHRQEGDLWFFTLHSPVALQVGRDEVILNVMRRPRPEMGSLRPLPEYAGHSLPSLLDEMPLPELPMRIVDPYRAELAVQFPAGDYALAATLRVHSNPVEYFNSQPVRLAVSRDSRPASAVIWASAIEFEPGRTLVQYQAAEGQVLLGLEESAAVPRLAEEWEGQSQLLKVWRTGPFEWQETLYDVQVETEVHDGKKAVALQNFDYDPIARTYTIAIKSLLDQPITDTLTVEVFGPGGIVIQKEVSQVLLRPDRVLQYTIEVPAELGQPEGIRVTLDDPLIETLRELEAAVRTLSQAVSVTGSFNSFLRLYADLFGVELIRYTFRYGSSGGNSHDFEFPLYDELMRDPWELLTRLGGGVLDGFNFNIFGAIYSFFFTDRSLDEIIDELIRLEVGGVGIDWGKELQLSATADFGKCPEDADINELRQRLSEIADRLDTLVDQYGIDWNIPTPFKIPLHALVAINIRIRLQLGGEVTANDLTIRASAQGSIGAAGRVNITLGFSLRLAAWTIVANQLAKLINGVLFWVNVVNLIHEIINLRIPDGDCDPDPPDPRPPDDRQDVWQGVENFYEGATHEETINNLSQFIQRAQAEGLGRAERLLTLRLREAELARFMGDRDRSAAYMEETLAIMEATNVELQAILSGTIPISPSETLTQALGIRYLQGWEDIYALSYPAQQREMTNAVDVAQRLYLELQGQELELQHELRQLFTGDVVGVLASGFAESTLSALEAMGVPSQLVSPWPSIGDFRGRPAPYIAPGLAPRALVVPSGGLHAIANSPGARDWLDAYVSGGGLLVVFSQAFGDDWLALPGGQVDGVGYEEDQRWQHATVEAGQPSDWLVWMGIERPDVQIDGAFTAWPENANILLKRTFGRFAGSPVMIEYGHGLGTVLVTTAYGDWAWQTNFWWGDDARLTHSILIRAYLLGRGQDVGDVFAGDPASTVSVDFPLTNSGSFTATQAQLQIPLVWGSGANSSVATVPLALGPQQGGTVAATLPTPPVRRGVHDWTQVGLYRVRVTVSTADGGRYTTWGPFVYVRSPIVPPALSGALLTEQQPASLFSTVTLSATVRNFTAVERTVTISDQVGLPAELVSLTVPANGTATQLYTIFMDGSKSLSAGFYDDQGKLIGRSNLVLNVAFPDLRATPLAPDALADGTAIPVRVTNQARQGQALAASLALSLTAPSGAVVWTAAQALPPIAAGQTITPTFTLTGLAEELGTYLLSYRVDDGRGLAREASLPLPSSLVLETQFDHASYRIRESGLISVSLSNSGRFDLAPTLAISSADLGLDDSQPLLLPVAGREELSYAFTVDPSLAAGSHPVVVSYQVGGQLVTRELSVVVPPAAIRATLADRDYAAGETIAVELANRGGVDTLLATMLRLVDGRGEVIAEETAGPTALAGGAISLTLPIPAGAASGDYQLILDGQISETGVPFALHETVAISGVVGGLTVQTGQPDYFSDEPLQALASVGVTAGSLEDGNLNLRICSPRDPLGFDGPIGPGDPGEPETRLNYQTESVALSWVDIAPSGEVVVTSDPVAVGDDIYSLVELGFTFNFYGADYSQAYVGSNGFVSFGSGYTHFSNSSIPSSGTPNNAIYALWTDLYPIGDIYGNVYAQQVDDNRFVVQWQAVSHCCSTGSPETFQVILDSSDDSITLQYLDVTSPDGATVGVENADGSVATQIAYSQAGVITDGAALRLTPFEEEIVLPVANFKSYLYTVGDVVFFSYEDDSELALFQPDGQPVWQGTLDRGQRQLVNVPTGTYLATGSRKFALMSGDPVTNGVAGYYASDQNGFGVSRELYTWTQTSFFSPDEFFIVFAYEDNTTVTVADADSGAVYFTGTLNNGDHWESNTLHRRWMHVTADKPVSAYTYYDQGTLVPAADGRWSGTLFYTYAGLVGRWENDLNVMAFEDDTQVTIQNLDTGLVYWTGTLNSGQVHSEVFGGFTARGAAYLSVSSDKTVAVTVSPFASWSTGYHQGFYAPDATGSRIGADLLAPMLSGGTMQVFAYHDDTVVQVYNSLTEQLINTYTLQAGQSVNANPGYGLWRLRSNRPVSAWAGWGTFSSEFAPVLFGAIVVGTPFDGECGYVLWEENFPVTTSSTFDLDETVAALNVTGRLVLDGRLFANTGQLLDHDDYPFYLHDRQTALTLEMDREVYRPGQTIEVSGYVTNTSAISASLNLVLSDGTSALLSQPLTLAPGEGYGYSTSLLATTSLSLTAAAANAQTSLAVVVAEPAVAAGLLAPDVAGREPFSVTLVISNTGVVSAAVQTTLLGQPGPSLLLQPGEAVAVPGTTSIVADTTLSATLSGDADLTLEKLVVQGELATLALMAPASDVAGPVEVPFVISGIGSLPTGGALVLAVNGAAAANQPFAVPAGGEVAGALAVTLPAGRSSLTGLLLDQNGNLLAEAALEVVLLAPAEPAIPQVTVANLTVTPDPVAAGDDLTVQVELDNDGAAGPVIVGIQLFDPEQQWVVNPPAFGAESFSFVLPAPADLPAGDYFGEIVVDGQRQPFTVRVAAADIEMSLALDQEFYYPGEVATLAVTLQDQAGVGGDYLVMPRYLVAEDYYTITVPANTAVQYIFSFTVTEADRVNVFLANTGAPPDFDRRVLMLDSLPVPVVQPEQGAYLTFDQLVYQPGDTIHGTLHLTGTLANVLVMGPMELAYRGGFYLWASPIGDSGLAVQGTNTFSYTLPTSLREGRYTFVVRIDGQSFTYPVDVQGWKVTTRHLTLDKARYNRQDELTAVVEFWNEKDETINGLELTALIFTPDDGDVLELDPAFSQMVDLEPGLNVFEISGAFSTPVVGPHRLLINIGLPGQSWRVAGAAAQFDVGWAHLVELTTDKGNYAPGEPGSGRLDVYGYGPTQLTVTASDGSSLLDQQVELAGFDSFTFAIPTASEGNYLLVARSVDQDGNLDELLRAYAVPAPVDTEPPFISLTYPTTRTLITSADEITSLTVSGMAGDNSGQVTVLINGQVVTPTAGGDFSLPIELRQGLNLVSAVAVDAAGNVAFTPIVGVQVAPARAITLAADQSEVQIGQPLVYIVVLSASGALESVTVVDRFPEGAVSNVTASASAGQASVNEDGLGVTWSGPMTDGQSVNLTISVTPETCGLLDNQALAMWGQGLFENSNRVTVNVLDGSTQSRYPIGLHASVVAGAQPGQDLGNIMYGGEPGNFGWLSWTGDNGPQVLAASLSPPGDSHTYVNPNDPNDHELSLGDWVFGTPGLQNSQSVRTALNGLIGQAISVPVWELSSGQGNNARYQISGFVTIEITGFELTNSLNRISAVYLGSGGATCEP